MCADKIYQVMTDDPDGRGQGHVARFF